mmetsp:Transcript_32524/g.74779  ORF Transcript_32524/g.74779 Transcript_32524/m.74779 type:complete len:179 (-) Transcript_32524:297-833(-)
MFQIQTGNVCVGATSQIQHSMTTTSSATTLHTTFSSRHKQRKSHQMSQSLSSRAYSFSFIYQDLLVHMSKRPGSPVVLSTMIHHVLDESHPHFAQRVLSFNSKSKFYCAGAKLAFQEECSSLILSLRLHDEDDANERTLEAFCRASQVAKDLFKDRRWQPKFHRRSRVRVLDGEIVVL